MTSATEPSLGVDPSFMRRGIGLFGGTFDPVHAGHIALAQAALSALSLERIDFLLAANPWQKHSVTAAEHRVAMLALALRDTPQFQVNLCEVNRSGATYTIDTLRDLRTILGTNTPLVLLLGGDQWENLQTWHAWQDFTRYCHLAVCERAGKPLQADRDVLYWAEGKVVDQTHLCERSAGNITFFSMTPHPANATQIRALCETPSNTDASATLRAWLDPKVHTYIRAHRLYGKN